MSTVAERPIVKYRVLKNVSTDGKALVPGEFITSDKIHFDENQDRAQYLVDLGYLELVDESGAAVVAEPDSVKVARAKAQVQAAQDAQTSAEQEAQLKAEELARVMSVLTPEQVAQIQSMVPNPSTQ